MNAAPAQAPCRSCPYRKDVPSGVWDASEYDKLPQFDLPMVFQPPAAFFCHQDNGRLCAGWVGCHDMTQSLGLRLACRSLIDAADYWAALNYESPVALFASGAEAAEHGKSEIEHPGEAAVRAVVRLERKLDQ